MLVRHVLVATAFALAPATLVAQQPPTNGPQRIDPAWHALVGARVIVEPGQVLDSATVLIRDGKITAVGENVTAPAGARIWDLSGKTVCAGFVEPWLEVEMGDRPDPTAPGHHWNGEVMPQRSALDSGGPTDGQASELRKLGFAAAAAVPGDGIFRGSASVVSLERFNGTEEGEEAGEPAERPVFEHGMFQAVALDRARDGYPRALMGIFALIRQTLLDADTRFDGRAESLDHLRNATLFLEVGDELDILRWDRIRRTSRPSLPAHRTVLIGSGLEFRRAAAVAATGMPIVVPLAYPDAPSLDTVQEQANATLNDLWSWEQAPTNARRLLDAGVEIALTSSKIDKRGDFHALVQRAITHGLTADEALAAVTTTPARLLGFDSTLGRVRKGYAANLFVFEGEHPFARTPNTARCGSAANGIRSTRRRTNSASTAPGSPTGSTCPS